MLYFILYQIFYVIIVWGVFFGVSLVGRLNASANHVYQWFGVWPMVLAMGTSVVLAVLHIGALWFDELLFFAKTERQETLGPPRTLICNLIGSVGAVATIAAFLTFAIIKIFARSWNEIRIAGSVGLVLTLVLVGGFYMYQAWQHKDYICDSLEMSEEKLAWLMVAQFCLLYTSLLGALILAR